MVPHAVHRADDLVPPGLHGGRSGWHFRSDQLGRLPTRIRLLCDVLCDDLPRTEAPADLEWPPREDRDPGYGDDLLPGPDGTRLASVDRDFAHPARDRPSGLHVLLPAEGTRRAERCVPVRGRDFAEGLPAGAAVPGLSVATDPPAPAEAFRHV